MNTSHFGKRLSVWMAVALVALSCSQPEKKRVEYPKWSFEKAGVKPTSHAKEKREIKPLTVWIGPGMAKSYAGAGVLAVLENERIPLKKIGGTGFGAVLALLYAANPSINRFDWALLKLETDYLLPKPTSWIKRLGSWVGVFDRESKVRENLTKLFKNKTFENLRFPVSVLVINNGRKEIVEEGLVLDAALAALDLESLYKLDPEEMSFLDDPYSFDEDEPLLLVNPLAKLEGVEFKVENEDERILSKKFIRASNSLNDLNEHVTILIEPEFSSTGIFDFSSKNRSTYLGKKAATQKLSEIKKAVGLK